MASRVQELPDDFDDKIDLNKAPPEVNGPAPAPEAGGEGGLSFDMMMQAAAKHFPAKKDAVPEGDSSQPGAEMPPRHGNSKTIHSRRDVADAQQISTLYD